MNQHELLSKKMTRAFQLLLLFLAMLLSLGCDPGDHAAGSAQISVRSQALGFEDVERVEIVVSGSGISPDIETNLSFDGSAWSGTVANIPIGDDRTFEAKAYDDSDDLIYEGEATGVEILPGETTLVVILLQQAMPNDPFENAPPQFLSLVADKASVEPGEQVSIAVTVEDPDGDPLTIQWSAADGSIDDPTSLGIQWTAPGSAGDVTVTVEVTDNKQATAVLSIDFPVSWESGSADINLEFNTWPLVTLVQRVAHANRGWRHDTARRGGGRSGWGFAQLRLDRGLWGFFV